MNTETLAVIGSTHISTPFTRDGQKCLLFSDGDSLNAITAEKDDSLIVQQLHSNNVTTNTFDLNLKLARKNFRTLGYANFEDEVLNQNQIQKVGFFCYF